MAAFSLPLRAELREMDLYTEGDKLITIDDNGVEWLDLTETVGLSYLQIQSHLGEGGIFNGWSIASIDQVSGLFDSVGAQGPYEFPYTATGYDGWSAGNNGKAKKLLSLWGNLQPENERSQFMLSDFVDRDGFVQYGQVQGISLLSTTKIGEDFFSLSDNLVTNEAYELPQLATALYRLPSTPVIRVRLNN